MSKNRPASKTNRVRVITEAEWNALTAYANAHGRTWKSSLRDDWMRGTPLAPELHVLRNELGPSWLNSFQLKQRKPRSTEDYAKHSLSGGYGIGPKPVRIRNGAAARAAKAPAANAVTHYALAQDKFMSGWGDASGGVSFFAIAAPSEAKAKAAATNLAARSEMKAVRVVKKLPAVGAPNHLSVVSVADAQRSNWYKVDRAARAKAAALAPFRSLEAAIERMYARVDESAGNKAAEAAEKALVLWVPLAKPARFRSDCLEGLANEYGAAEAKQRMKDGIPGLFIRASDVVRGFGFEGDLALGYANKGKVYSTEHCGMTPFVERPDIVLGRAVAVDENMELFPVSKAVAALTNLYAYGASPKPGEPQFSTERTRRGY